jgi:hypothetical protein
MRNWIKRVAEVKINGIDLSLGINQRSVKVQIGNKICSSGFGFHKAVLREIKFELNTLRNLFMDDEFKYFGKCIKYRNRPVITH